MARWGSWKEGGSFFSPGEKKKKNEQFTVLGNRMLDDGRHQRIGGTRPNREDEIEEGVRKRPPRPENTLCANGCRSPSAGNQTFFQVATFFGTNHDLIFSINTFHHPQMKCFLFSDLSHHPPFFSLLWPRLFLSKKIYDVRKKRISKNPFFSPNIAEKYTHPTQDEKSSSPLSLFFNKTQLSDSFPPRPNPYNSSFFFLFLFPSPINRPGKLVKQINRL